MPHADPVAHRAAMKRWRDNNREQIALYDAQRPPRVPTEARREQDRQRTHRTVNGAPRTFVGTDGEGMGEGSAHEYYVWRMGRNQLVTGQPLTTEQCLWFIAEQEHGPIYTIFSGNYDFTMMLRGLPPDTVADLLNRPARERDNGVVRPTAWGELKLDYIPHKRLSVRKPGGQSIIIHDVFGFLQCSFVSALDEWDIGTPEQRRLVVAGKERRGNSDVLSPEELEYNQIECELLADLVKRMDDTATAIGITMAPYEGAGALANSLFRVHVTNPLKRLNKDRPDQAQPVFANEVDPAVNLNYPTWDAYFGGRFEITAHGPIRQPVFEYDINSAYPHIIRALPCLWHGRWVHNRRTATGGQLPMRDMWADGRVTIGHVRWVYPEGSPFGPLPHRNKQGNVTFPLRGSGWYWSLEWPSDPDTYTIDDSYTWEQNCDHKPFYWVYDRYQQRKQHKAAGRKGEALLLKYGYNSLYGKFVQSVGKAPWRNSVYGGLITSGCRRMLRDAAEMSPQSIVMFATDGIYSLTPLELNEGTDLGQWEANVYEDGLHLVRPGIYFSPDGEAKIKTRGISRSVVQKYAPEIKEAFNHIYDHPEWLTSLTGKGIKDWGCQLEYSGLISLRLAHSQNRPDKAGYFGTLPHRLSYDIAPKRVPRDTRDFDANWVDGILRTAAPPIGYPTECVGYKKGASARTEDNDDELDLINSAPDGDATVQLELFA